MQEEPQHVALPPQFIRDFTPPLSACIFTGRTEGTNNIGSVLQCITHTPIYCESKNHEKNTKPRPSFTVVRIVQEGWCYSNWRKPKNKADKSGGKGENSQPLFEVLSREQHGGSSVIKALKMYQFVREGQFNKGDRDNEKTFRYNFQIFMYDEKKNGASLFPENLEVIPEFSIVEIVVLPQAVKDCGYGMKIATIRPIAPTLHSYLSPLGLGMFPTTSDSASDLSRRLIQDFSAISSMVETTNVVFMAQASIGSYVCEVDKEKGYYRLTGGPKGLALSSLAEVDLRAQDIVRFLNAGEELADAIFLIDLAVARGALHVLVFRNPYFVKQAPGLLEYRGIPLIDPTKFLSFIDTTVPAGEDNEIQFDVSAPIEILKSLYALVAVTPAKVDGAEPTCKDFPISLPGVETTNAYQITLGDEEDEDICSFYYSPASGTGIKHACSGARMDYRALKMMRRAGK